MPAFDAIRGELESVFQPSGSGAKAAVGWICEAIDYVATRADLTIARRDDLHWGAKRFPGAAKTYLLRTEQELTQQIDAGQSVILATSEEPRRYARYLLRRYSPSRPVYLWTVASGLYKVRMFGDDFTFSKPGDPAGYSVDAKYSRLSAMCREEDSTPRQLRDKLVQRRDFRGCEVEYDDGKSIKGFLRHEEEDETLTIEFVADDMREEGGSDFDDSDCERALHLISRRHHTEFVQLRALLDTNDKPFPEQIRNIMTSKQRDALFVMLDAQMFLETQGPGDSAPIAATFLKDASARLRRAESNTQVVVLSTPITLTRSLTDELTCIELPLPSRSEIAVELRRQLKKHSMLDLPSEDDGALGARFNEDLSLLIDAAAGMTLRDLGASVRKARQGDNPSLAGVLQELQAGKRMAVKRSPALELVDLLPERQISLGGVERLQSWLSIRRRIFEHPEQAKRFGIERRPKGVLLLGIPGTGKSLAAKVVAREWKLPLVRLDMGAVQNMFVGASEQRIRDALRIVEAMSPCVLWIDEIDKGIAQGEGTTSHSTDLNIRATLLTWLQESRSPVFCVATANRFSNLPPELTRAGRFDARFFLGCPNEAGRRQILSIHLTARGLTLAEDATSRAVTAMHGFTGAEIEQSVLDALYSAFADSRQVTGDDIVRAAERTKPIVRGVGGGLDEVWKLIEEGRVEPASDEFLNRVDLMKLIDPTLFSPMYCRLVGIEGWDRQAKVATRMLMSDPTAPRAAAITPTGDPDWIYVQLNVKYSNEDEHTFKFLDRISTIGENGVLDTLVTELGIEVIFVETEIFLKNLSESKGFGPYAELLKTTEC